MAKLDILLKRWHFRQLQTPNTRCKVHVAALKPYCQDTVTEVMELRIKFIFKRQLFERRRREEKIEQNMIQESLSILGVNRIKECGKRSSKRTANSSPFVSEIKAPTEAM